MSYSISDLQFLVGTWEGTGVARYPTIESTEYTEELSFATNARDPIMHYEQRTWFRNNSHNNGLPVFWESGFLIDRGDGVFELASAQKSGRVEVLRGRVAGKNPELFVLDLESVSIINDDRMIRSARHFEFTKDSIIYELTMSTTKHPLPAAHLNATLKRRTR